MVNKIFGTNISVRFSELWRQEWEAYKIRSNAEDEQEEQEERELVKEGEQGENAETENGTI